MRILTSSWENANVNNNEITFQSGCVDKTQRGVNPRPHQSRAAERASAVVRTQLRAHALDGVWQSPVKSEISSPWMHGSHFLEKFLQTPVYMHGCGWENSPSSTDSQNCNHLCNSRTGCLCPVPSREDRTLPPRDTLYPHPQTLKTDVVQH